MPHATHPFGVRAAGLFHFAPFGDAVACGHFATHGVDEFFFLHAASIRTKGTVLFVRFFGGREGSLAVGQNVPRGDEVT